MRGFLRTSAVAVTVGGLGLGAAIAHGNSAAASEAAIRVAGPPTQVPVGSEVRQLVTFSFLPGKSTEALAVLRDRAIPLYANNEAMLSFRAFREVESPVSLDLIIVSAFAGMSGMDKSNANLSVLAAEAGTSIGAIYGRLGGLSSGHTDQFVEMLPSLGSGDPSSKRLTALVWYRNLPGEADAFEGALETAVVPWEESSHVPSATGRFLVSDGWHYLRFLGFDSLGDYHEYWSRIGADSGRARIIDVTAERREVIVASVPALAIR